MLLQETRRTAILWVAAALLTISWSQTATAQSGSQGALRDDQVHAAVQFEVEADHGEEILLRYTLELNDPSRVRGRHVYPAWLAGPEDSDGVSVEPVELFWVAVTEDGLVEGPYHQDDETRWGTLPTQFSQVRTGLIDTVRLAGWHKADFLLSSPGTLREEEGTTSFHFVLVDGLYSVTVEPAPEDRRIENLEEYDPHLLELAELVAINAPQIHLVAAAREPIARHEELREWNEMLREAERQGPLLKARVPRAGIHYLSSTELRAAGVDPDSLDPGRTRVYLEGRELPVLQEGSSGPRFVGDTRLVFYVPKEENDRKPYRAIWFVQAPEDGSVRRLERIQPAQASVSAEAQGAVSYVRVFEPNLYNHEQPVGFPTLRWGTGDVPPGAHADFEFSIHGARFDEAGRISIWLHNRTPANSAEFELLINGQQVHEGAFRGTRTTPFEVELPGNILREGTNTLTVHNTGDTMERRSSGLTFVLAELRVPVDVQETAPQQRVSLDQMEADHITVRLNQYGGFESRPAVLDVTDPFAPVAYNFRYTRTGTQRFHEGAVRGRTGGRLDLVWSHPETHRPVQDIERVAAPRFFLSEDPATYLAIHYRGLREELEPLLDHHRGSFDVEAVEVNELYDAFSYGEKSYQAIHGALRHVFAQREGARLQKVLLVGEASEFWWEYERGAADVAPNMIPIYGWADPSVRIRGDESYTLLFGNGPLSDVDLGRFSVNDAEELAPIVEKTLAYLTEPPPGEWMNQHVFVLDDEPEFIRVASDIIRKSVNGPNVVEILALQDFPFVNYFRGIWRKRSVEMTEQLIDRMNQGALTINYLGHGGPNIWSSERIFHLRDIELLENGGRHPILIAGSCDTGWIDYPTEPVAGSLSEQLLRRPEGGVVAAFIPVDGTTSYEHNFLITEFYRALMGLQVRDVGRLTSLSKMNYYLYRNNRSVTNQFVLMGDPALITPAVREDIEIAVRPERLASLTGGQLAVEAVSRDLPWGVAQATLVGPDGKPVHEERLRILDGRTQGTLRIPDYLEPGRYQLLVSGFSQEDGVHKRAVAPLEVVETDVELRWVENEAATSVVQAGRLARLELEVVNNSEAELPRLWLKMVSGETGNTLVQTELALPAGADGQWRQQMPLPPGVMSIHGRLAVPPDNEREQPLVLAEDTLILRARDEQPRYVDLPPGAIEAELLPDGEGTRVTFPVYNMYQGTLPTVSATLVWKREGDDVQLGEAILIEGMEENAAKELEFKTGRILPEGPLPLALELHTGEGESRRLLQARLFQAREFLGPDLKIVPDSLHVENEHALAGTTVFVRFTVRNVGTEAAGPIRPEIYIGEPWREDRVAQSAVSRTYHPVLDELLPGQEHEFRLRWDPESGSEQRVTLHATVEHQGDRRELNLANNEASLDVHLLPPANLAIDRANVRQSHQVARPYERVRLSVPFSNISENDFRHEFRASVHANGTENSRRTLLARTYPGMRAGESAVLQFDWEVLPGEYEIEIDINEDREYMEETYENNVHRIRFTRALDSNGLLAPEGERWDFGRLAEHGQLNGLRTLPGGHLTLVARPQAKIHSTPLYEEFLVEGSLGFDQRQDNLWGYRETGEILLAYGESAEPVRFRFPMNRDDDTAYYDIYIEHVGDLRREVNSGHFRYRFGGERDWQIERRRERGRVYMGRYMARHGHMEAEFDSVDYPSFNHIWRVHFAPVLGIHESPVVTHHRALDDGVLRARMHEPGAARVEFEVRCGTGELDSIAWSDWLPARPDHRLPAPPAEARHLQWRATLFGAPDGMPELHGVSVEWHPEEGTPAIAAQAEIRERHQQ